MCFCSVVLVPAVLFAWGGDDHQIVCLIAEDRLTPEARTAIHELLGADVNISDAEIANWAKGRVVDRRSPRRRGGENKLGRWLFRRHSSSDWHPATATEQNAPI
jgi:hypothetical protein